MAHRGKRMLPGMDLMNCPNLAVPNEVMHHVVRVESSYNPYAIGVVGGRLARQPKNLAEALATVRMLEGKGYNFSLGLAQVNRYNLGKYGIESYQKAFEACPNLQAGSRILAECHGRSGGDWGKSFSCYYSGNFVTGFRHGYVQKVYASMGRASDSRSAPAAIEVIAKPGRRPVAVTRHPDRSSDVVAHRVAATDSVAPATISRAPDGVAALSSSDAPAPVAKSSATPVAPAIGGVVATTSADHAFVF